VVPRQLLAVAVEMLSSEVQSAEMAGPVQHQVVAAVEHIDPSVRLFWKAAIAVVVLIHMELMQVLPRHRAWREGMKSVPALILRLSGWLKLFERQGRSDHRRVSRLEASLRLLLSLPL